MAISEKQLNSLLQNLSQPKRCKDFVRLLKTIPGFSLQLTDEESTVIGSPGNNIVIGRSGTGKTTCAMLRLLAMQVTFKYWEVHFERPLAPEDLDTASSLHTVFVTAAPVLCNEVQNYYHALKDHIKEQIRKRSEVQDAEDLDDQPLFNEEEGDAQSDEEAEEELAKSVPMSLLGLTDSDFPLFLTARRLVFMIDAAVRVPFFARDKTGNILGQGSKFEWHNEGSGQMVINKGFKQMREDHAAEDGDAEFSSESEDDSEEEDIGTQWHKPSRITDKKAAEAKSRGHMRALRATSFEVTAQVFETQFWPLVRNHAQLPPFVVWSEIYSQIKGASLAFTYPGYYLPLKVYRNGDSANMYSPAELEQIYNIFIRYERWKVRESAFDLQDVVNYLNYQIHEYGFQAPPIHYMMIDEVQDLTHATIKLFMQVTQQNVFFSGDTAQTIAKGVGFKFGDLYRTLQFTSHSSPKLLHLHRNFRSHHNILKLANSVVSIVEVLFPTTIDILSKEFSTKKGPKPVVINTGSVQDLIQEVYGGEIVNSDVPFGCNMAVLVRNQEAKALVSEALGNVLCLTIYEAKGLEFDDVILFNFFQDSETETSRWRVLKDIKTVAEFIAEGSTSIRYDPRKDPYKTFAYATRRIDSRHNAVMCNELKKLYVAITRPKERLFIFDMKPSKRTHMQQFWERYNLVQHATDVFKAQRQASVVDVAAWRQQGMRMLKHKFYLNAARCFEVAGETALAARCRAHFLADKAALVLITAQQNLDACSRKDKKRRKELRLELAKAQYEASGKFREAAQLFLNFADSPDPKIQRQALRNAARCFASSSDYLKAGELFEELGLVGQAAEAFFSARQYYKAAELFEAKGEYMRQVECYSLLEDWEQQVKGLNRNKEHIHKIEKLVYKYLPLALEELTENVLKAPKETAFSDNINKNTGIEEIKEEDEDSEEETPNSGPKPGETKQEVEPEESKQGQQEESKQAEQQETQQAEQEEKSESFVVLDESKSENSFLMLNSSMDSAFTFAENESLHDINPDDPFLQSETGSVIDSVVSGILPDGTLPSEYSLLDLNPAVPSHQLIKTRHDIYAEDQLMYKVIEYLSMFSEEITVFLHDLRSKDSLVSSQMSQADWDPSALAELDEISPEILGLLLDVLEEFQMYKLCLIVCNRYGLAERLGRYLVSIASTFSNLSDVKVSEFRSTHFIATQSQRTALAYGALHNAFEMVEPKFLSRDSSGCLGLAAFQGLLLLGYWKKLLFIVDWLNAMALAYTFSDYSVYFRLYQESGAEFKGLTESAEDYQATLFCLEQFLIMQNTKHNLTLLPKIVCTPETVLDCFPLNQELWNCISKRNETDIVNIALQTAAILRKHAQAKEYSEKIVYIDAVCCLAQILIMANDNLSLNQTLASLSWTDYETFLRATGALFKHLEANSRCYATGLTAVYIAFGAKLIWPSSISGVLPWETHAVLHRHSILTDALSLNMGNLFVADLEANLLLIPITELNRLISTKFLHALRRVQQNRSQVYDAVVFDVHAQANLLAEAWLIEEQRRRIREPDAFTLSYLVIQDLVEQNDELSVCHRQLQAELMKFGEEPFTEEEIEFIRTPKVVALKKRIRQLTKQREGKREHEALHLAAMNLLKLIRNNGQTTVKLTRLAQWALFQLVQRVFERVDSAKQMQYLMWIAFEFAKVAGFIPQYQEMLYSRFKPTIDKSRFVKTANDSFRYCLGWTDVHISCQMQVYGQVAGTTLDMLAMFKSTRCIDMLEHIARMGVFAWALAEPHDVSVPSYLFRTIPLRRTHESVYHAKVTAMSTSDLAAEWLKEVVDLMSLVSQSDLLYQKKIKKLIKLQDLVLIIFVNTPSTVVTRELHHIYMNYLNSKLTIYVELPAVLGTLLGAETLEVVKQVQTTARTTVFPCVVKKEPFEGSASALMDSQWYHEMGTMGVSKRRAFLAQRLKPQLMENVRNQRWVHYVEHAHPFSWLHPTCTTSSPYRELIREIFSQLTTLKLALSECVFTLGIRKPLDFQYLLQNLVECDTKQHSLDLLSHNPEGLGQIKHYVEQAMTNLRRWKTDAIPRSQKFIAKAKKQWYVKWGVRYKGFRVAQKLKKRRIK